MTAMTVEQMNERLDRAEDQMALMSGLVNALEILCYDYAQQSIDGRSHHGMLRNGIVAVSDAMLRVVRSDASKFAE
jgi:hypothetical protein